MSKNPLTEADHNARAAMLRAGLVIRGFTLLEAFIRTRTAEALAAVDPNVLAFDALPERLRRAATLDALKALAFQAELRRRRREDYVEFVQTEAQIVASGASAAYSLSGLAFANSNSNVLADDVTDSLRAVGVEGGWSSLGNVASRAGLGIPALDQSFKSLSQLRNMAAHDAAADVAFDELQDLELEITAVALAYDSLLSAAVDRLRGGDANGAITANDVRFRFVRPTANGRWREVREGAARASRVHNDLQTAWSAACVAAQSTGEVVVRLDAASVPARWRAGGW